MSPEAVSNYLGYGAIALAAITVTAVMAAALRSGVIKAVTFGPLSIEGGITSSDIDRQREQIVEERPFEARP